MRRTTIALISLAAIGAVGFFTVSRVGAQRGNRRVANEAVGSAELRTVSGLLPSDSLLFNGWGITPVGEHVTTSDMPLRMVVSPDGKALVAVSVAALTIYDMCKAVDRGMVVERVQLEEKSGGRSGHFRRSEAAAGVKRTE